jgi:hypothetical protein
MKVALPALLFLVLLGAVAWAIGYYLDPTLADFRDIVIIVYGVMGILLFTILIATAAGLFFAGRSLAGKVEELLAEPIRPALEELRETARNARGASEFYADHAVSPLIKTVAAARGARRGLSSITRLAGRGRKR